RRLAGTDGLVDPRRAGHEVAAATRDPGCRTVVSARNSAVEDVDRQDEGLRVAGPVAADARVAGPAGETGGARGRDASRHAAAVVADEVTAALTGPGPDWVDAGVEAVAADRHLPLRRAGRVAGEAHDARGVVLRAAGGRWVRRV